MGGLEELKSCQSPSHSKDATAAAGPSEGNGRDRDSFEGPGCCRLLRAGRLWPDCRDLLQVQGGVLPLKHAGPVSGQTPHTASALMPGLAASDETESAQGSRQSEYGCHARGQVSKQQRARKPSVEDLRIAQKREWFAQRLAFTRCSSNSV